nr:integrase, catalytic region, zinc finger, CCHC-type, peptidase aspartic, catalytic [Tanacetum cinerariifolium]
MLDRTDFASWKQCIRLYYQGKENGVNIIKSIDEGPFQMRTVRETLTEGTEGAPHLGPERPRVYSDLSPEENDRYNADIRAINILLQGLPKDIYTLINHYTNAKDLWDNVKMLLEGSELTKEYQESQHYFNPPPRAVSLVSTTVAASRAVDPAGSPSSTTIDQDLPSASSSPTTQELYSQVTHSWTSKCII